MILSEGSNISFLVFIMVGTFKATWNLFKDVLKCFYFVNVSIY
jgi:hypothetical protein